MALKLPLLTCCVSLTLMLLLGTTVNAEEDNSKVKQLEIELKKLNLRVGKVELKNNDQDDAILFLKSQRDATLHNIIKQNEFIEPRHHQAYYESNNKTADHIYKDDGSGHGTMRQKRPFRLLPAASQLKIDEDQKLISNPPSSCKDINTIGHTLNGIYLVKDLNKASKIKALFCDFQSRAHIPSSSTNNMKEKVLGYIDVKPASGIYFYVQSFNQSVGGNGVILFYKERLNIGSGMNLKSGVFTAPRTGTYAFFFSILKNGYNFALLDVALRVNGIRIVVSAAGVGLVAIPITQQATIKLKKGDRIDLQEGKSGQFLIVLWATVITFQAGFWRKILKFSRMV